MKGNLASRCAVRDTEWHVYLIKFIVRPGWPRMERHPRQSLKRTKSPLALASTQFTKKCLQTVQASSSNKLQMAGMYPTCIRLESCVYLLLLGAQPQR